MYNFSIFVDDSIASDFNEKIQFCNKLQLGNMEISDKLDDHYVADLTGEQLESYRKLLIRSNKKLVLLNSSRSVAELEYYKELFRKAYTLGVENVNIIIDRGDEDKELFNNNFKKLCRVAETYGLEVLTENSATGFLSNGKAIAIFYGSMNMQNTGLIFNPLEYVKLKSHPFLHEFYNSKLKGNIKFLRVNDGLFINGLPTLPAQGNGEIKELTSILLSRSFKGYFSFTPYFEKMNANVYIEVIESFTKLLMEM